MEPGSLLSFPFRITARDMARPIPRALRFPADMLIRNLLLEKAHALGRSADDSEVWTHTVVLIEQGSRVLGSLYGWDELSAAHAEHDRWYNSQAGDVAIAIEPSSMIGGDTALEGILKLFADPEERLYFVLTGHEITHVLTLLELTSAPVRMALFAKILEMEDAIQGALLIDPKRHVERLRKVDAVAVERLERRARANWRRRQVTPFDLIRFASLGQKSKMLVSDEIAGSAVTPIPAENAGPFFKRVEQLRDLIAHGHNIRLTNPAWEKEVPSNAYRCDELYGLLVTMTNLTDGLRRFQGTQ